MSSVDNFVRKNILMFPFLFKNRTDVLHHALCVIGNGYDWNKRGAVYYSSKRPAPLWDGDKELEEFDTRMKARYPNKIIRAIIGKEEYEHIKECSKVVAEVDTRIHERREIKDFYPQTEYALLMNIPDNVTDDWKQACEEMKTLAWKAGWAI